MYIAACLGKHIIWIKAITRSPHHCRRRSCLSIESESSPVFSSMCCLCSFFSVAFSFPFQRLMWIRTLLRSYAYLSEILYSTLYCCHSFTFYLQPRKEMKWTGTYSKIMDLWYFRWICDGNFIAGIAIVECSLISQHSGVSVKRGRNKKYFHYQMDFHIHGVFWFHFFLPLKMIWHFAQSRP